MKTEDFKRTFMSLGLQEKELFADEVIMFLDSQGFPSPRIIENKTRDALLKRYQNTFGNLEKPPNRFGSIVDKEQHGFAGIEMLFDIEDNFGDDE